jgi:hypothetical protein
LLQFWPKGIKAQSIPNDTADLRVQHLLAMAHNIVVHQQLNLHVHINSSEVASDTDETLYGAVSGEKHRCTLTKVLIVIVIKGILNYGVTVLS